VPTRSSWRPSVVDDLVVANLSRTQDIRAFVAAIADWLA
jgi:hypothetical protein